MSGSTYFLGSVRKYLLCSVKRYSVLICYVVSGSTSLLGSGMKYLFVRQCQEVYCTAELQWLEP